MKIMSTAMVSAFYDYGDNIYKPRNLSSQHSNNSSQFSERRNMGSPVSSLHSLRRTASVAPAVRSETKTNTCSSPINEPHRKLDRSLSEPVDRNRAQTNSVSSNQANSSRYKTELCRPYEESGTCKYGEKCQFAHGAHELRTLVRHPKYKTELCRTFHSTGFCPYGPRCHFIHNSEETKKNLLTHLQTAGMQSVRPSGETTVVCQPSPAVSTPPSRPKALSIGSYSLGSTGDLSPPSSISGSPTSPNSFFVEEPYSVFSPIQPEYNTTSGQYRNFSAFTNDLVLDLISYRDQLPYMVDASPPSPVESLCSEVDSLSLGGSPVPATCSSPLEVSRNMPRLPIFSRLANSDSE